MDELVSFSSQLSVQFAVQVVLSLVSWKTVEFLQKWLIPMSGALMRALRCTSVHVRGPHNRRWQQFNLTGMMRLVLWGRFLGHFVFCCCMFCADYVQNKGFWVAVCFTNEPRFVASSGD